MKSLLPSIFMPICAWAGVTAVMEPPMPEFADGESSALSAVETVSASASEIMTVSVSFRNAATNQLEVWICTDEAASRTCRDVVFGIDEGRLFVGGHDVGSWMFDSAALPFGQVAIEVTARSRQSSGDAVVGVSVNGVDNVIAKSLLAAASPLGWRSLRVLSRGLSDDMPTLTVVKNRIGSTLKIR